MTTTGPLRIEPDEWALAAACRGRSDIFFQPDYLESKIERRRREATAKSICHTCRVRAECLSQAVAERERFGIWGGLTERERRAMFARLRPKPADSPQDVAGSGRAVRLPAAAVQSRLMSSNGRRG